MQLRTVLPNQVSPNWFSREVQQPILVIIPSVTCCDFYCFSQRSTVCNAMRSVHPGNANNSTLISIWHKHAHFVVRAIFGNYLKISKRKKSPKQRTPYIPGYAVSLISSHCMIEIFSICQQPHILFEMLRYIIVSYARSYS